VLKSCRTFCNSEIDIPRNELMLYSIFPLVSIWTNVAYQKLKKMKKRLNESAPMEFDRPGCVIGDHSLIAIELHHPSQTCGTRFAGKLSDQYLTPTRT